VTSKSPMRSPLEILKPKRKAAAEGMASVFEVRGDSIVCSKALLSESPSPNLNQTKQVTDSFHSRENKHEVDQKLSGFGFDGSQTVLDHAFILTSQVSTLLIQID